MDALGEGPADIAIVGAPVYTVDRARPWAEAVAVRGGRIAAVGSRSEIQGVIGSGTEVIELEGGLLLPGFQDAHVHPLTAGLEMMQCDLTNVRPEGYPEAIARYASDHPDEAWIVGGGWRLDAFPNGTPRREALDGLLPHRPAFLINRDGHGAWVNSRALELAGIAGDTPDPADGRIERDGRGEPTGALHEGAMNLVEGMLPPTTRDEWERSLILGQEHLHALGVTAWQDAIVDDETLPVYASLARDGRLTARVVGALWWDRHRGEEQVDELIAKREENSVGRFRPTSVKIMQDGILENFTAGVLEPYLGPDGLPSDRSGLSFVDPDLLKRAVSRLDREDFQVHVHAIGDRAVREALDAFEAARAENGPTDGRHHIAHLQVIHPDDIPRFAALGVVANVQPYWACLDKQMRDLCFPILGPERTGNQYPFGRLLRSGARLAFGSDWSVTTANPLLEIQVAVTRLPAPDEAGDEQQPVFLPEDRLDLATAIEASTMGSAYVNHLDGETGSIESGKLADLVVLDASPFDLPPEEIGSAKVVMTMVEGDVVFSR